MRTSATRLLWQFLAEEEAPAMAEYGLLLVFIALLAFTAVVIMGDGISTFFTATGEAFASATIPTVP